MTYHTFLPWNALGGTIWAGGFARLGYLAGSQYTRLEHDANDIDLALLGSVVIVLVIRSCSRKAQTSNHEIWQLRPHPLNSVASRHNMSLS